MRNLRDVLVDSGLDLTGWTLASATGISSDGLTIVGFGKNPSGFTEGWIAQLGQPVVPEPCTSFLLGGGLAGILGFRRKGLLRK